MLMRMFPLGGVHFPHTVIPLRVFEPRYRQLVDEVLDSGERFGVVLIERGFEVGGGDTRFDTGTAAEIVETAPLDDDAIAVVARGVGRVRIDEWLDDDPYPRALVTALEEPAGPDPNPVEARRGLTRLRALLSELGADMGSWEDELPSDPIVASYHLAALSPVGPLDAQELLAAPDATARLRMVEAFCADLVELAQAQLGGA